MEFPQKIPQALKESYYTLTTNQFCTNSRQISINVTKVLLRCCPTYLVFLKRHNRRVSHFPRKLIDAPTFTDFAT